VRLNFAGSKNGTSYLDDFENSRSVIDIKSAVSWQIAGTPQMFPESQLFNDLSYGYNRARLAFYNIDPIFYTSAGNIPVNRTDLSNHYVRQVIEQEVFPFKQSVTGQPLTLSTLNLAFYPTARGQYNYSTSGINTDGSLQTQKTAGAASSANWRPTILNRTISGTSNFGCSIPLFTNPPRRVATCILTSAAYLRIS
jgi:cell surface protein SprA